MKKIMDKMSVVIAVHTGELEVPFPDSVVTFGIGCETGDRKQLEKVKKAICFTIDKIGESGLPLIMETKKCRGNTQTTFRQSPKTGLPLNSNDA